MVSLTSIKLRELGDDVFLASGSPATLIVIEGEIAYVVDPGCPSKRGKLLRKALAKRGVSKVIALLTHGHGDHVSAVPSLKPDLVLAPLLEIGQVIEPAFREGVALEYPFHRETDLMMFELIRVPEAEPLEDHELNCLSPIELPGHTFGHVGFLKDKFAYVGDAVFGDKLLGRVGVPFYLDHRLALETIARLRDLVRGGFTLILSHGPVVKGGEALKLLDKNEKRLREVGRAILRVLRKGGLSDRELAFRVLGELGAETSPLSVLLASKTVKSFLAKYYEEGVVRVELRGGEIVWALL